MNFSLVEDPVCLADTASVRNNNREPFLTVKSIKNYRPNNTKKQIKKEVRPKMTKEELDAELEAYMACRN